MSRLLAEAEWAAFTHAQLITWGSVAAIAIACYGLLAVPSWISDWRQVGRIIRQTREEAAFAAHAQQALDVTQPITTRLVPDRRGCGCATRENPRETLTCPEHAQQQLIDLEAMWRRREDAQ